MTALREQMLKEETAIRAIFCPG